MEIDVDKLLEEVNDWSKKAEKYFLEKKKEYCYTKYLIKILDKLADNIEYVEKLIESINNDLKSLGININFSNEVDKLKKVLERIKKEKDDLHNRQKNLEKKYSFIYSYRCNKEFTFNPPNTYKNLSIKILNIYAAIDKELKKNLEREERILKNIKINIKDIENKLEKINKKIKELQGYKYILSQVKDDEEAIKLKNEIDNKLQNLEEAKKSLKEDIESSKRELGERENNFRVMEQEVEKYINEISKSREEIHKIMGFTVSEKEKTEYPDSDSYSAY